MRIKPVFKLTALLNTNTVVERNAILGSVSHVFKKDTLIKYPVIFPTKIKDMVFVHRSLNSAFSPVIAFIDILSNYVDEVIDLDEEILRLSRLFIKDQFEIKYFFDMGESVVFTKTTLCSLEQLCKGHVNIHVPYVNLRDVYILRKE